jgi:hypothetical protein
LSWELCASRLQGSCRIGRVWIVGWNQEMLIIGCEYGLADDWE